MILFSNNKEDLHKILNLIRIYLKDNLKLELKSNYQIFPVNKRGIDFIGYVFRHTHIRLRPSIKKRFIKMIKHNKNKKSIASYFGWILHCNGVNLRNKYINNYEKQ